MSGTCRPKRNQQPCRYASQKIAAPRRTKACPLSKCGFGHSFATAATDREKKRRYASSWPTETRAQRRFRSPPRYVSDRRAELVRQPRSPAVSRRQPALPADWRRQADCLPRTETRPADLARTSRDPRIVRARSIPVYSSSPAGICHPLLQNLTRPLHVRLRNGYKDTTVHRVRHGHVCHAS